MRTRLAKRLLGDDRGTTTIEFALIFPLLAAVLFGIIDVGRFIGARVMLAQAASVGARTACLNSTNNQTMVDDAVARRRADAAAACRVPTHDCLGTCRLAEGGRGPRRRDDPVQLSRDFFRTLTKTMTQTSRMVCE